MDAWDLKSDSYPYFMLLTCTVRIIQAAMPLFVEMDVFLRRCDRSLAIKSFRNDSSLHEMRSN